MPRRSISRNKELVQKLLHTTNFLFIYSILNLPVVVLRVIRTSLWYVSLSIQYEFIAGPMTCPVGNTHHCNFVKGICIFPCNLFFTLCKASRQPLYASA